MSEDPAKIGKEALERYTAWLSSPESFRDHARRYQADQESLRQMIRPAFKARPWWRRLLDAYGFHR